MIEENNCCVMCGNIIPEGSHCCSLCNSKYDDSVIVFVKKEKRICSLLKRIKERILKR